VGFAPGAQDRDGFIFCSVRAPDVGRDRGFVSCTVDGKILGAASVHNHPIGSPGSGCWSPYACFCVPLPRHLPMSIDATASAGKLDIKVWHLASTSQGWKFGEPEQYTLNALHTAETDGFLNGVVTVQKGNARGMLFLYCGRDGDNIARQNVIPAMMAAHNTTNRHIPYASSLRIGDAANSERLRLPPGSARSLAGPRTQPGDSGSLLDPTPSCCMIMYASVWLGADGYCRRLRASPACGSIEAPERSSRTPRACLRMVHRRLRYARYARGKGAPGRVSVHARGGVLGRSAVSGCGGV